VIPYVCPWSLLFREIVVDLQQMQQQQDKVKKKAKLSIIFFPFFFSCCKVYFLHMIIDLDDFSSVFVIANSYFF